MCTKHSSERSILWQSETTLDVRLWKPPRSAEDSATYAENTDCVCQHCGWGVILWSWILTFHAHQGSKSTVGCMNKKKKKIVLSMYRSESNGRNTECNPLVNHRLIKHWMWLQQPIEHTFLGWFQVDEIKKLQPILQANVKTNFYC